MLDRSLMGGLIALVLWSGSRDARRGWAISLN